MITFVVNQKIRNAFSGAAHRYDRLTDFHKSIGRRLAEKVRHGGPFARILDIGMGTGGFTGLLTESFPSARVIGIDFAAGMIDQAREKERAFLIVQGDAFSLPFKDGAFDAIVSNLAYQWMPDLARAFGHCRTKLNQGGKLYLTIFGHDTFGELFETLKECLGSNDAGIRRLAGRKEVTEALEKAGFHDVRVSSEYLKTVFPDMIALIKWIKEIGANALAKDFYLGKDLVSRMNGYYNECFHAGQGVYATSEIIWVEADR